MASTKRDQIDDFFRLKRLAVVGVSRDPKHFSSRVFRDLRRRGYEVIPVNPHATELEGQPAYARVQDIQPPVAGALVMTLPEATEQVVKDCLEAGVKSIWLHRPSGPALSLCREQGIAPVANVCPYMFMPQTAFFHWVHRFFARSV